MDEKDNSEEQMSLQLIMDKLNSMETRIENNFSQIHSDMAELRCEFKQQIDDVKDSIKEIEKSLENAWAAIEDVQQEIKAYKDSKRSHQEVLDNQTKMIQELQAEVTKIREENQQLRPSLKEAQEKLIALENYTRRENVRIMNIPEDKDENCWNMVHDIIENDLKINTQDIHFHAVHRVSKATTLRDTNDSTPTRPRPIIARFVNRVHTERLLSAKNRLKKSDKYKDAHVDKYNHVGGGFVFGCFLSSN